MNGFLPVSGADMRRDKIEQLDFVYITGDAYVDHPSFGPAIISRVLEAGGYSVGIIAQPDWKDAASVTVLGRPRLAFLISAGNMDSMVNHYYVSGKRRESDAYSPGGAMGRRPDRATAVYGNLVRQVYREVPIIIGGIEASLRRLAHYDYWSNAFKRSVLLDSQADILSYGMGERSIIEIADALNQNIPIKELSFIRGCVYKTKDISAVAAAIMLPDYTAMKAQPARYAESFRRQLENTDALTAKPLIEAYPGGTFVVQNPPALPLTTAEMDRIYDLPYRRNSHPMYDDCGGIPALKEIKFSLTSSRGCFGGCSFCALTFHQGRRIQARSHDSLLREARLLIADKDFKGYLHDVGGPTANFRQPSCAQQLKRGVCPHKQCLYPQPCANLRVDHHDYLTLLRALRALPGVKKVFVRSGIRFDYLCADPDDTFFRELVEHHVSGQLKVAPEHIAAKVLNLMGKPDNRVYENFTARFRRLNEEYGKKQFAVPYLMSSHPGSTLTEAIMLAEYLRDWGYMPEQVQDFYPTPSTVSTVMYYTGLDPRSGQPVYVCRNPHEKAMQRALIQYRNPRNRELVAEALRKAGRTDLIGFGQHCLVRPRELKKMTAGGGKSAPDRMAAAGTAAKTKTTAGTSGGTKVTAGSPNGVKSTKSAAGRPKKKKTIRNIHKKVR